MVTEKQITLKKVIKPDNTPIFNSLCDRFGFEYDYFEKKVEDEPIPVKQNTKENKGTVKPKEPEVVEPSRTSKYLNIEEFYSNEVLKGNKQQDFHLLTTATMISRYVQNKLTEGVSLPSKIYSWMFSGFYGINTAEEFGETHEEGWKKNLYTLGELLSKDLEGLEKVEVPIITLTYQDLKKELENSKDIDGLGPFQVLRINKVQVPKKNFSGLISLNEEGEVELNIRTGENKGKVFKLQEEDTVDIIHEDSDENCNIYKQLYELI